VGLRGSLLHSDTPTNTFDAANRLIKTEQAGTTLEPIYNRSVISGSLNSLTVAENAEGLQRDQP
jgi:hypothetical protein